MMWLSQAPALRSKIEARAALAEQRLKADLERKAKKAKKSSQRHAFYRTAAWLSAREQVFARDGYKCAECGDEEGPMNVDHIRPRSKHPGLALTLTNLRPLCWPCNRRKASLDVG